jgi:hypothetical protein
VGPNGGRGDGPDRPVSDETLCRAAARGIGRCPHSRGLPTRIFSAATLLETYRGHPLYYYVGDAGPGDDAGEGLTQFGAEWYVLGPDGAKVDAA